MHPTLNYLLADLEFSQDLHVLLNTGYPYDSWIL